MTETWVPPRSASRAYSASVIRLASDGTSSAWEAEGERQTNGRRRSFATVAARANEQKFARRALDGSGTRVVEDALVERADEALLRAQRNHDPGTVIRRGRGRILAWAMRRRRSRPPPSRPTNGCRAAAVALRVSGLPQCRASHRSRRPAGARSRCAFRSRRVCRSCVPGAGLRRAARRQLLHQFANCGTSTA